MNEKIWEEWEKELDSITLKELCMNKGLYERLQRMSVLIADFLRLINPRTRPMKDLNV